MELVAGLLNILRPFQCTPGSMLFTASETGELVMFVLTKVCGSGVCMYVCAPGARSSCLRATVSRRLTRLKRKPNKMKSELNRAHHER